MMKYYKDLSWDSQDLIACKNVVRFIVNLYGLDEVSALDAEHAFGNLDVDAVLSELGYSFI